GGGVGVVGGWVAGGVFGASDARSREVHSFPTRRSSDLRQVNSMSRLDELIQELCPDGVAYKTLNEICNISAGGDVPKDTFSKKEDRKSTRLNSSHVSISYAVFCLNKQIIPYRPLHTAPR